MTPKQTKSFNAATAELEAVRSEKASAHSDIQAAQKTVNEADAVLKAAHVVLTEAQTKFKDLLPYEELALRKTRKVLDEALPGVANGPRNQIMEIHAEHANLEIRNGLYSGGIFDGPGRPRF